MKLEDLKIGQFATHDGLCIKRHSEEIYHFYKKGQYYSHVSKKHNISNVDDFKLCDCNGKKLIEEFTYPLYMESIQNGTVIKFVSLHSGMVIIQGKANDKPGHEYPARVKHNDYNIWKPCDFSKAPEIEDLDYLDARYNAGLPVYFSFNYENNKF